MTFGELYLAQPGLFPRRLSGEPWGDEDVALEIAGIPFSIEGLDPRRAEFMRKRYEGWVLSAAPAGAVRTRVFRADDADFFPFPGKGREITTDLAREAEALSLCGPMWMARVETAPLLRGALFLPPGEAPLGGGAIENYLRIVTGHALLGEGGAVVHSAAIVERGMAHLFPAASGGGKSTLSRMSDAEGRVVLSDDMNALVLRDGCTCVAQVPFSGDFRGKRIAGGPFPLAAVYRLRKGDSTLVSSLGLTEALGLLFAETPSMNTDPEKQDRLLDVLEALLDGVALRTLTFSRSEPRLWSHLVPAEAVDAVA